MMMRIMTRRMRTSSLFVVGMLVALSSMRSTCAFDYDLASVGSISLMDSATSISDVVTLFLDQAVIVSVSDLEWVPIVKDYEYNEDENILHYETRVDGILQEEGNISLKDVGRELPSSIDVGEIIVTKAGRHEINVTITVVDSREEGATVSTVAEYESYNKGLAIIPLMIIMILAVTTNMVR